MSLLLSPVTIVDKPVMVSLAVNDRISSFAARFSPAVAFYRQFLGAK